MTPNARALIVLPLAFAFVVLVVVAFYSDNRATIEESSSNTGNKNRHSVHKNGVNIGEQQTSKMDNYPSIAKSGRLQSVRKQDHEGTDSKVHLPDTPSKSCAELVKIIAHQNMSDSEILKLSRACLKSGTSLRVGPELFQNLFTNDTFGNIKCAEPDVRPNEGPALPVIALASFAGSGNTWTRVLLDQLTGLYTGSYGPSKSSRDLLKGSTLCPYSKVFIIKTHAVTGKTTGRCNVNFLDYQSAIYILRNPYNVILAEFNRRNSGKVTSVTRSSFKTQRWTHHVNELSDKWKKHVYHWLFKFKNPVHVLVYEHLVQSTLWELYKISKFVNRAVTFENMWCIQYRQALASTFKRKKPEWLQASTLFSKRLKGVVNNSIDNLTSTVGPARGLTELFESYLLN